MSSARLPASEAPSHGHLRAVLCVDTGAPGNPPFLIAAGADAMIDLARAERVLETELRAATPDEVALFNARHGVSEPVATFGNDPRTLVDSGLMELDEIDVPRPGGDDTEAVEMFDMFRFARECRGMRVCAISAPVPPSSADDDADILGAVSGFTQLRIQQRIDETLNMPPLPEAAQRIIAMQSDPNYDLSDITDIIETDPSLAAQVVGWANSPYYGAQGTVTSIDDAIMRVLGFDAVINMALGLALGGTLRVPNDPRPGVSPYWLQAVFTATAVEGLIRVMRDSSSMRIGLGYLAGLLNNFGYLVLAHVFPGHFERIARLASVNQHIEIELVDRHVLGVSRNQLAAALLDAWSLPDEVVQAVRWQNEPERAHPDHRTYADLVYMATHLLRSAGISVGPEAEPITQEHYTRLDINPEAGDAIIDRVLESADEVQAIARSIARSA